MTLAAALKYILIITVVWLGLIVLALRSVIWHEPTELQDWMVDDMAQHSGLAMDALTINQSYSDPPTFAGDFFHAICAVPTTPVDTTGFVSGSAFNQEASDLDLARFVENRVAFMPSLEALKTDDYLIRVIESDGQILRYTMVPLGEQRVCYVAIKI